MRTSLEIREAVRSLDPNVLAEVHALQDNLENYRWPSRMVTILSSTLGDLAPLLTSIGVYSVVASVNVAGSFGVTPPTVD